MQETIAASWAVAPGSVTCARAPWGSSMPQPRHGESLCQADNILEVEANLVEFTQLAEWLPVTILLNFAQTFPPLEYE